MNSPLSGNEDNVWLEAALAMGGTKGSPWSSVPSSIETTASSIPMAAQPINSLYEALSKPILPQPMVPRGSFANELGQLALLHAMMSTPGAPGRFNQSYIQKVIARSNRRIEVLSERLEDITTGRVMPDRDDITIGSARRFDLAIMFLDICGFSARPNWLLDDQKKVLKVMNMFMAEMLSIVHDFAGTYEKNTGDGLMAYFGENENSAAAAVKPAAEAALIMHYVNDQLLTPWFESVGIPPVVFRIGIDYGPVMIARVGIHGEKSSLVAVGTAANIANKLMNRIANGGICIGDEVRKALPHNWASTCKQCSENSGFVYTRDHSPYSAWELNHRLSTPTF